MSGLAVYPATEEHADALALVMREEDRAEAWAAAKLEPRAALAGSMLHSRDPMSFFLDGKIVGMAGVGQMSPYSRVGAPWLLSATLVWPPVLFRASRVWVREALKNYEKLENYVDARSKSTIKWLRWVGFSLDPAAPYGFLRLPFHRFTMER
jgi:hypothetical protein